jgi:hypothetical protein
VLIPSKTCRLYLKNHIPVIPSLTTTPPGSVSNPDRYLLANLVHVHKMIVRLTMITINVFHDRLRDGALHRLLISLSLQLATMVVTTTRIDRTLECISLPPKHVIAMISMPRAVQQLVSRSQQTPLSSTYASPIENTNGCVPFSPHNSFLLNGVVSNITSYIICGKWTGKPSGHFPLGCVPSGGAYGS